MSKYVVTTKDGFGNKYYLDKNGDWTNADRAELMELSVATITVANHDDPKAVIESAPQSSSEAQWQAVTKTVTTTVEVQRMQYTISTEELTQIIRQRVQSEYGNVRVSLEFNGAALANNITVNLTIEKDA